MVLVWYVNITHCNSVLSLDCAATQAFFFWVMLILTFYYSVYFPWIAEFIHISNDLCRDFFLEPFNLDWRYLSWTYWYLDLEWCICFCQSPYGMRMEMVALPVLEYLSWISWNRLFGHWWHLKAGQRLDYGFVAL